MAVTIAAMFASREHKAVNRNYYNAHLWKARAAGRRRRECRSRRRESGTSSRVSTGSTRFAMRYASVCCWPTVSTFARWPSSSGTPSPGFTLRVYCHLLPSSEDKTRKAVDRAFVAVDGPTGPGLGLALA